MSGTEESLRFDRSPTRCPFCHDGLEGTADVVACAACGARHHGTCRAEHGRCASCGSTALLVPPSTALSTSDERSWAMLCQLAGFAGHVFPFGSVVVPYLLWQTKKGASRYVDRQGSEAVNFQLTILLAVLVCIPLVFVVVGFFLLIFVALFHAIYTILGTIKASRGEEFRYPLTIRFLKADASSAGARSRRYKL